MEITEQNPDTLIYDPITGELIDPENVDQMLDRLEAITAQSDLFYAVVKRLRLAIAAKTSGDSATRRIVGARRRAKVTLSEEIFDQSVLRELFNSHPQYAKQYLKVAMVGVQLREYRKLENTSSDQADFNFFRSGLIAANKGRIGLPRVELE
jgi:hypothetical protein